MEYTFEHWVNQVMHAHPLLARAAIEFSSWGVALFGVMAVGLWLLSPPGHTTWKRACAAGLSAAAVGLLVNQMIIHLWERARPYDAHHSIVPLVTPSVDPSFPSDHATAAFSIAFGVFFVSRRAGWLFLGFATLVAMSRVLVGMHYPTDVLASLVISAAAGYLTARVLMRPLLMPMIAFVGRFTDAALARVAVLTPIRHTVLQPRFRARAVALVCALVLVRIVAAEWGHVLDEMPLATIAAWLAVAALAVRLSAERFWPHDTVT